MKKNYYGVPRCVTHRGIFLSSSSTNLQGIYSLIFSFLFLFIPRQNFFLKLFPKILARSKNITYLCHCYNSYVEHST